MKVFGICWISSIFASSPYKWVRDIWLNVNEHFSVTIGVFNERSGVAVVYTGLAGSLSWVWGSMRQLFSISCGFLSTIGMKYDK